MAYRHDFDHNYTVTDSIRDQFDRNGFVKLEGFVSHAVLGVLSNRFDQEMSLGMPARYGSKGAPYSRGKYDFETDKAAVYDLLARPYFRRALTDLAGRSLFLTFELGFEIALDDNQGVPWHVGSQSFGYQNADEFGCTVWIPLQPVDSTGQRGGLTYVPDRVLSGAFVYEQVEPGIVSAMAAKERAGIPTTAQEYHSLRAGAFASPPMLEILERHRVEDDFEPGDALLFNKWVPHRSVALEAGDLTRRAAFVLRFVDLGSHYDFERAHMMDYGYRTYGTTITRQHIEIAEAGAQHGDLLAECEYFDNRERRTLVRDKA